MTSMPVSMAAFKNTAEILWSLLERRGKNVKAGVLKEKFQE